MTSLTDFGIDPVLTAVLANRIESVVREMTNTLLRAARSAVINSGRDFSCAICTGDNQLLACAEGLPIHIFGSDRQAAAMCASHPDLAPGDAFLHNDVYTGNTHPADHTFLVPVFFEGEHLFTAVAKAHQADIGNALPTTYHPSARDVYEEGSLIFPAVRIQRDYRMIDDIVRMCRSRIRVPDQWYGDFLAGLGAARIAERRLIELCEKYGRDTVKTFIAHWFDYSEQRMAQAIATLPAARLTNTNRHDPFEGILPEGVAIKAEIVIEPEAGMITVDLRDNVPNVACGLNVSESCTVSAALTGVFNALDPETPKNAGAFRRVRLLLKDGAVIGRPAFPHSCSIATTNIAARLVNCVGAAFAALGDGYGLAESGVNMAAGYGVISGADTRSGQPYVNQLIVSVVGGPASPRADGWVTHGLPVSAGLTYRDSIEIDELKHPMEFRHLRLVPGAGGAGRFRGAPGADIAYGPIDRPMTVIFPCDGNVHPPLGVLGGGDGQRAQSWLIDADGSQRELPNLVQVELQPGQMIRSVDNSGGGYGDPLDRAPERVLADVLERWETPERAEAVYGVVLTAADGDGGEAFGLDLEKTRERRAGLRRSGAGSAGR